jgi:ADP-ribose pyrophosphatase YjhB (NUDIX family)
MPRPDVHIDLHLVLLRDGCVLMGKRLDTAFGAGQYHVPAGHLEVEETIVDGVIREAREETGIALAAEAVDLAYVLHFRGASDRLSLFFVADRWQGTIANREPEKCAGWEWIATSALPENTVAYARHALTELLAGRRLGLFGWPGG